MEVNESYYCWAVINKKGLRQVLGTVQVKAIFIAPVIELSEESLEFEINVGPYDCQGQTCISKSNILFSTHVIKHLLNDWTAVSHNRTIELCQLWLKMLLKEGLNVSGISITLFDFGFIIKLNVNRNSIKDCTWVFPMSLEGSDSKVPNTSTQVCGVVALASQPRKSC